MELALDDRWDFGDTECVRGIQENLLNSSAFSPCSPKQASPRKS